MNAIFAHGERFGQLTVLRPVKSVRKQGPRYWCGCSCGRMSIYKGSKLRKGLATRCDRCEEQHKCKED